MGQGEFLSIPFPVFFKITKGRVLGGRVESKGVKGSKEQSA